MITQRHIELAKSDFFNFRIIPQGGGEGWYLVTTHFAERVCDFDQLTWSSACALQREIMDLIA